MVKWTNKDPGPHTVTSDPAAPVSFGSGNLDSGGTYSFTFTQGGTYAYHCDYHATMHGTVIVQA